MTLSKSASFKIILSNKNPRQIDRDHGHTFIYFESRRGHRRAAKL